MRDTVSNDRMPDGSISWSRALVIGLGASGRAAASLLADLGVEVRGYDRSANAAVPEGVEPVLGELAPPDSAFADVDLLVLSPGVPPEPVLERRAALAPRAEVHGEMSLALALLHARARRPWTPLPTVLITGTNGKSTVTALVGELLAADGRTPFVGGNLGATLCERLSATMYDRAPWPSELVLECSSFQLETLPPTPTDVGIVLNVTPDHLDRYPTMEAYARTKARVFDGLSSEGLALLSRHDAFTDTIAPARGRVVRVGADDGPHVEGPGEGDTLVLEGGERIQRSVLRIRGRHNADNAVFALLAARHLGVPLEACRRGLASFPGLPHRMVLVRELDDVAYYDDSKATNVASALASLGGLDRPFVLIAGGLAKGDDLGPLRELLLARGRGLVAIGDAADRFFALADGELPAAVAGSLEAAVSQARAMARPGDAVVLAPACASFDMFRSYAHRGEVFTAAVLAL
jgi:UDP-N-acetylmuramoylalanine--D-glutamate ligase